ncbi:MAG: hypothetical protein O7G13_03275, partial [Alphaproteobacteria bacterium]|nr:hypothetical protein [Alphaproteobacteria bacterium]
MAARLGNVLYWLGTIIAVLAIGGAITWNGVTYYELQDAEERLAVAQTYVLEEAQQRVDLGLEAVGRGMRQAD